MSTDNAEAKTSPWIWVALIATLLLTVWSSMQEESEEDLELAENTQKAKPRATKRKVAETQTEAYVNWDKLERAPNSAPKDLFRAANWAGKAKKLQKLPVKKAPPPAPKAPPIPFSYMGRLDDGPKGDVIYLADQEKSYSVTAGSKVGPFWRFDKEENNQLYFTFLPLDLPKTLSKDQNNNAGFN